ncbi:MAG: glycosyltransferase [Bacteroidales bacterium]|nr:glycosyltransferase [Bacteroidales bacterium]
MKTLTIVMPAFNAGKYIGEAIQSIIQQSFKDWTLIVVDDCSSDNTVEVVEKLILCDERISLLKLKENSGAAKYPRLKALELATSEWIAFVDADDVLDEQYFEKLFVRQLETSADIVLAKMFLVSEDLKVLEKTIPTDKFNMNTIFSGEQACRLTLMDWEIGASGIFHQRLSKIFFQNATIYMNADELDTRRLFFAAKTIAFAQTKYLYRMHSDSITHTLSLKSFDKIISVRDIIQFVKAAYPKDVLLLNQVKEYYKPMLRWAENQLWFMK